MNAVGTGKESADAVGERKQGLEVVLLYEDFSTGLRARQTFEQVAHQLEVQSDFEVNLWRFDLLGEPALLERAAGEAAQADLVLLSAHGQSQLPPAVTSWFNRWLARKGGQPCALAVSFDPGARDLPVAKQTLEALRAAAWGAGVEVFEHTGEAGEPGWESAFDAIHRRAEATTTLLEEVLQRAEPHPYRDWGINE